MSEMWNLYPSFTGTPVIADTLLMLDTTATPPSAGQIKQYAMGLAAQWLAGQAQNNTVLRPNGTDDTSAINAGLASGGMVTLAFTGTSGTPFKISSDMVFSTGSCLRGAQPYHASPGDFYGKGAGSSGGSVVTALASFSGTAAVTLNNTTAAQFYGANIQDVTVDMSSFGGSAHGIFIHGAWAASTLKGVCVNFPAADALHFEADATQAVGPDDWRVTDCKFSGAAAYGVNADNIPDSWFVNVEASDSELDNWFIGFSLNTKIIGCKGENSGTGAGFHLSGQNSGQCTLTLIGCGTHLNHTDGYFFDNASGSSGGGNYLLSGCYSDNDGAAGGTTFAGFRSNGALTPVIATACSAFGAAYGASQTGTSAGMTFVGCELSGSTAPTHDDGSNTVALQNQLPAGLYPQVTTPDGLSWNVQGSQLAATSAVTVANTATATAIATLTVPKGGPVAGTRFRVTAFGTFGTETTPGALTVSVNWGGPAGTVIVSFVTGTSAPALTASLSGAPVQIEAEIYFRTSSTATGWVKMTFGNAGTATTAPVIAMATVTTPVTVTVSAAEALALVWKWTTANASNTVTIASSAIERVS